MYYKSVIVVVLRNISSHFSLFIVILVRRQGCSVGVSCYFFFKMEIDLFYDKVQPFSMTKYGISKP